MLARMIPDVVSWVGSPVPCHRLNHASESPRPEKKL